MKIELIKSKNTLGINIVTKKYSRLIFLEKEVGINGMGFTVSLVWEKYVRYSK